MVANRNCQYLSKDWRYENIADDADGMLAGAFVDVGLLGGSADRTILSGRYNPARTSVHGNPSDQSPHGR